MSTFQIAINTPFSFGWGFNFVLFNSTIFGEAYNIDYSTYYFAIVCFKSEYTFGCTEYIYQVASNTKMYYSMNYLTSAGKAFWKYIQPYNENLGCAPNFQYFCNTSFF